MPLTSWRADICSLIILLCISTPIHCTSLIIDRTSYIWQHLSYVGSSAHSYSAVAGGYLPSDSAGPTCATVDHGLRGWDSSWPKHHLHASSTAAAGASLHAVQGQATLSTWQCSASPKHLVQVLTTQHGPCPVLQFSAAFPILLHAQFSHCVNVSLVWAHGTAEFGMAPSWLVRGAGLAVQRSRPHDPALAGDPSPRLPMLGADSAMGSIASPSWWSSFGLAHGGVPWRSLTQLPHGVAPALARPSPQTRAILRRGLRIPPGCAVFTSLSSLTGNKRVPLAMRAVYEAAQKLGTAWQAASADARLAVRPPCVVMLVKGIRDLYGMPARLDVPAHLLHSGVIQLLPDAVSTAGVHQLLGATDVYLAAYYAEGFGMPLLEAAAAGAAVVATAGGPSTEFASPLWMKEVPAKTHVERGEPMAAASPADATPSAVLLADERAFRAQVRELAAASVVLHAWACPGAHRWASERARQVGFLCPWPGAPAHVQAQAVHAVERAAAAMLRSTNATLASLAQWSLVARESAPAHVRAAGWLWQRWQRKLRTAAMLRAHLDGIATQAVPASHIRQATQLLRSSMPLIARQDQVLLQTKWHGAQRADQPVQPAVPLLASTFPTARAALRAGTALVNPAVAQATAPAAQSMLWMVAAGVTTPELRLQLSTASALCAAAVPEVQALRVSAQGSWVQARGQPVPLQPAGSAGVWHVQLAKPCAAAAPSRAVPGQWRCALLTRVRLCAPSAVVWSGKAASPAPAVSTSQRGHHVAAWQAWASAAQPAKHRVPASPAQLWQAAGTAPGTLQCATHSSEGWSAWVPERSPWTGLPSLLWGSASWADAVAGQAKASAHTAVSPVLPWIDSLCSPRHASMRAKQHSWAQVTLHAAVLPSSSLPWGHAAVLPSVNTLVHDAATPGYAVAAAHAVLGQTSQAVQAVLTALRAAQWVTVFNDATAIAAGDAVTVAHARAVWLRAGAPAGAPRAGMKWSAAVPEQPANWDDPWYLSTRYASLLQSVIYLHSPLPVRGPEPATDIQPAAIATPSEQPACSCAQLQWAMMLYVHLSCSISPVDAESYDPLEVLHARVHAALAQLASTAQSRCARQLLSHPSELALRRLTALARGACAAPLEVVEATGQAWPKAEIPPQRQAWAWDMRLLELLPSVASADGYLLAPSTYAHYRLPAGGQAAAHSSAWAAAWPVMWPSLRYTAPFLRAGSPSTRSARTLVIVRSLDHDHPWASAMAAVIQAMCARRAEGWSLLILAPRQHAGGAQGEVPTYDSSASLRIACDSYARWITMPAWPAAGTEVRPRQDKLAVHWAYEGKEAAAVVERVRHKLAQVRPAALLFAELGPSPLPYFLSFSRLAQRQGAVWGFGAEPPQGSAVQLDAWFVPRSVYALQRVLPGLGDSAVLAQICAAAQRQPAPPQPSSAVLLPGAGLPLADMFTRSWWSAKLWTTSRAAAREAVIPRLWRRACASRACQAEAHAPESTELLLLHNAVVKVGADVLAAVEHWLQVDPRRLAVSSAGYGGGWQAAAAASAWPARWVLVPRLSATDWARIVRAANVALDAWPYTGSSSLLQAWLLGTPAVLWSRSLANASLANVQALGLACELSVPPALVRLARGPASQVPAVLQSLSTVPSAMLDSAAHTLRLAVQGQALRQAEEIGASMWEWAQGM